MRIGYKVIQETHKECGKYKNTLQGIIHEDRIQGDTVRYRGIQPQGIIHEDTGDTVHYRENSHKG